MQDRQVSIYPWDIESWRSALQIAGIPGLALLSLLLGTMIQYADPSSGGPAHTSTAMLVLVRGPLCVVAFLLLLFQPQAPRLHLKDARVLFFAFAILYFVSTLWSTEHKGTLGKAVEIFLAGMAFWEVSRTRNALQRVEALRQIILLTISLVAFVTVAGYFMHIHAFIQLRPGIFTRTTAQAPFLSGNGLGYVSSALFLVVFAEWQAKRLDRWAAFRQMAFAMFLFAFAASRTSFAILILSVIFVVVRKSSSLGAFLAATVFALGLAFQDKIMVALQGKEATSDFTTLSGRTVMWNAAIRQWQAHPLLGAGGGVGGKETLKHIGDFSLQTASSLHNGFMELLTGLGAIGFALGAFLLILATWRTWKAWRDHPQYAGTYVLIIHVWMTTVMSTGVLGWMGYEMALFLCIITNTDLVRRQYAYAYQPVTRVIPAQGLTLSAK